MVKNEETELHVGLVCRLRRADKVIWTKSRMDGRVTSRSSLYHRDKGTRLMILPRYLKIGLYNEQPGFQIFVLEAHGWVF